MRTNTKHREFDLIFDKNASNPLVKIVSNDALIKYNETIHVIEYAAFEHAATKCEEAQSELLSCRKELEELKETYDIVLRYCNAE